MQIRLLGQTDIRQTLTMRRSIDLMETAFIAITTGEIHVPARTNISSDQGVMLYKPALMPTAKIYGMKAVSVFPGNAARNLPVTTGVMLINDSETGLPLAIMDAELLTAIRTGAATGLATRLLAHPTTTVAALFGTGGQALCQLEAMLAVLPLETVHVFSRKKTNAEAFCRDHSQLAGECHLVAATSTDVLRECGVITTATNSKTPVFAHGDLASGVHINGVGSFTPDAAEVPPETVIHSAVFVDQREAALREAGDIVRVIRSGDLPMDFAPVELGEILMEQEAGRTSVEQTTFFKSVGNAAQDMVCAAEILAVAEQLDLGQVVEL